MVERQLGRGDRLRFLIARHLQIAVDDPGISTMLGREARNGEPYFGSKLHGLNRTYVRFMTRTLADGVARDFATSPIATLMLDQERLTFELLPSSDYMEAETEGPLAAFAALLPQLLLKQQRRLISSNISAASKTRGTSAYRGVGGRVG